MGNAALLNVLNEDTVFARTFHRSSSHQREAQRLARPLHQLDTMEGSSFGWQDGSQVTAHLLQAHIKAIVQSPRPTFRGP